MPVEARHQGLIAHQALPNQHYPSVRVGGREEGAGEVGPEACGGRAGEGLGRGRWGLREHTRLVDTDCSCCCPVLSDTSVAHPASYPPVWPVHPSLPLPVTYVPAPARPPVHPRVFINHV